MKIYLARTTLGFSICLLGLGFTPLKSNSSTLLIGKNNYFAPDINSIHFSYQEQLNIEKNLQAQNIQLPQGKIANNKLDSPNVTINLDNVNQDINEGHYDSESLSGIANPDKINQNIDERYYGLVESEDKTNLFENTNLVQELIQEENSNLTEQKNISDSVFEEADREIISESANITVLAIVFSGGLLVSVLALSILLDSENKGILGLFQGKFAKPTVPDSSVKLHQKNLRQLMNFGGKAEAIDDDKFSNQEFVTYLKIKHKIDKGSEEYGKICHSIKYLEVAIIAQGSYLKIEQTELRYRSRKQQAFYQFVTDTITDDIDLRVFQDRVKKKLGEVIPLVNSEEGRSALQSYVKEVNKIAQHSLGLKLLARFKKYQLSDFTILRKVSDIVERVNAQDVLTEENLKILILENYEDLEKLSPILGIMKEDMNPEIFIKMLQYLGLVRRHEKAFQQFQSLIKVLRKWKKPYKALQLIREQYPRGEYTLPKEFTEKIPGLHVYKRHEEYLNNNPE